MKKYKVELTESQKYIVDVLAKNAYDAKIKATKKWNKIVKNGIDHYNEVGDKEIDISCIYDVTGTDDPFDAENDEELSECEKQILDKEGEEALARYQGRI